MWPVVVYYLKLIHCIKLEFKQTSLLFSSGIFLPYCLPPQATNFHFMAEYGNPQLAKDEAGYYVTTLEAAIAFIENLSPNQLTQPTR